MRQSRFYVDQPLAEGADIALDERNSHYLLRVLRLKPGDALIMFNGNGYEYSALLEQASKKQATVKLLNRTSPQRESPLHIEIGQSVARGERMDFVLQKSVELGVQCITPLWTRRSQVRLDNNRLEKRLAHWHGVVHSACEQSGRVRVPELQAPVDLNAWLATPADGLSIVLSPRSATTLKDLPTANRVRVLVGPEGGLEEEEIHSAETYGFQAVCLGPRILRTETAALATLTALQVLWGDLSTQSSDT
jgi:16S rRNA (uracil1498-N3)-methyltransferase